MWGVGSGPALRWAQRGRWQIPAAEDAGPEKANRPQSPSLQANERGCRAVTWRRPASAPGGPVTLLRQAAWGREAQAWAGAASERAGLRSAEQHGQRKQGPHPCPRPCQGGQAWGGARTVMGGGGGWEASAPDAQVAQLGHPCPFLSPRALPGDRDWCGICLVGPGQTGLAGQVTGDQSSLQAGGPCTPPLPPAAARTLTSCRAWPSPKMH